MKYLAQLTGKKIIVLGLGMSGLSTLRFLLSHNIIPKVVDSRQSPPGKEWIEENQANLVVHYGELEHAGLIDADMIIISPGIALANEFVLQASKAGIEIIGDIELFARINDKPIVAVTGSNGKSSVVTLAANVLIEAGYNVGLGGNIGTPILDLLSQNKDIYVLELSSFQLETTSSLSCLSAVILNISEDHLDRYPSMIEYIEAKHRIYSQSEICIYNNQDINTYPKSAKKSVSFGLANSDFCIINQNNSDNFSAKNNALFNINCLPLEGKHNQLNALAVLALLSPLKLKNEVYIQAFSKFQGLKHRCQLVKKIDGVSYFNDSKATNVGACIASIEGLYSSDKKIILIAGGDGKGADFSSLKYHLDNYVEQLICIGKDAELLMALDDNALFATTMAEAVRLAKEIAQPGFKVLLAPACASLDMYPNFMARGDDFVHCVLQSDIEEQLL